MGKIAQFGESGLKGVAACDIDCSVRPHGRSPGGAQRERVRLVRGGAILDWRCGALVSRIPPPLAVPGTAQSEEAVGKPSGASGRSVARTTIDRRVPLSTLTKVFIVLLVVFSIAFTTMTVSIVAQTANWRDLANTYEQHAAIGSPARAAQ